MKTKIWLETDIKDLDTIDLPELKHIPAKGEIFHLDKRAYPIHAKQMELAEKTNKTLCCVESVEHYFTAKIHLIIINVRSKVKTHFFYLD